MSQLLPGTT